jgi:hypothetical protein
VFAFKEQMALEKELEGAKVALAARADFNLMDAFRIFDASGKGWVDFLEFSAALAEFGVKCDREAARHFFIHFDNDCDGRLRFSEFADALTPQTPEYAHLLITREPLFIQKPHYQRYEYFNLDTRIQYQATLSVYMQYEDLSASIRQKLSRIPEKNLYAIFEKIDEN